MNENTAKLVKALRSGKYDQTTGRLRRSDSFCCLGVATDLYHKETGEGRWTEENDFIVFTAGGEYPEEYSLPDCVVRWLGWNNPNGEYQKYQTEGTTSALDITSLAEKNDEGVPFEKIADIIESEPEGLFE